MKRKMICEDKLFINSLVWRGRAYRMKVRQIQEYQLLISRYHLPTSIDSISKLKNYLQVTTLENIQTTGNWLHPNICAIMHQHYGLLSTQASNIAPNLSTGSNDPTAISNIAGPNSNTNISNTSGPINSAGLNLPAPTNTTIGPNYQTAVLPSVNSTTSNIAGTTSGPSNSSGLNLPAPSNSTSNTTGARPNDPMAISSITNPSNSQKVSLLNDNKPLSSTSNPLKDSFSGGLGYKEDYIEKFLELVTKFMEKIIKYFF